MTNPVSPTPANAPAIAAAFVDMVGTKEWGGRITALGELVKRGQRTGRAGAQRHAIELTIERLRKRGLNRPLSSAERAILAIAVEATRVLASLPRAGRERMRAAVRACLSGDSTLVGLFHLVRTGAMQRGRGFDVGYCGFAEAAPFDLLLSRESVEAEVACDVLSAEEGRDVHRGAWVRLVDAVDPDLQTWLESHPGRYLLKLTLPQGLKRPDEGAPLPCARLADLHARIRAMLQSSRRADHDETAVLRLDPLMLAAAQADELGLLASLRREFGHEAHLAVTAAGGGVFVLAARAAREDEVAVALRRRLAAIAPARLTGTRPGILAMFVEDTDGVEWQHLRDRLQLEGEARQFLTFPEAKPVVAVTCCSRLEMFETDAGVEDGELRFRNQAHPAAKTAALAPAVVSSI